MRYLLGSLFLVFVCRSASAGQASVYLSDGSSPPNPFNAPPPSVEPIAARFILAERLGVSRFHSLKDADEATFQAINDFQASTQDSNGDGSRFSNAKALILVEGVERPHDLVNQTENIQRFFVSTPPTTSLNLRLLADFASQASYLEQLSPKIKSDNIVASTVLEDSLATVKDQPNLRYFIHGDRAIVHIGALEAILKHSSSSSTQYRDTSTAIRDALRSLLAAARDQGMSVTLALYPVQTGFGNLFKRNSSPYGSYSLPDALPHARRQLDNPPGGSPSEPVKSPDSLFATSTFSTSSSTSKSSTSSAASTSSITSTSTPSPPSGILPACFSSESECNSATNSCSGRGSCVAKYIYKDPDSERTTCYGCLCEAQKKTNQDGTTKTTIWSGPACQKRDVSVEFWLLGGFTIFFVSLLSWGLGMMYTMGQEDLPSVIGAGVAGPRAK